MVNWLECFLIFTINDWLNHKEMGYDENNICRIQSTVQQHWCLYQCRLYASHWLLGSWKEFKDYTWIRMCFDISHQQVSFLKVFPPLLSVPLTASYIFDIGFIVSNLLIVKSIICCKNQKHFNQFTMSLLFCVILFYRIFLVSAAASVGTEQMSTGHLVPLYFTLSEFVNLYGKI